MTTRWRSKLTDARKNGDLWWLRRDGTTRVTFEHVQRDDGSVGHRKIHNVVTTQHTEPLNVVRSEEVAENSGPKKQLPARQRRTS